MTRFFLLLVALAAAAVSPTAFTRFVYALSGRDPAGDFTIGASYAARELAGPGGRYSDPKHHLFFYGSGSIYTCEYRGSDGRPCRQVADYRVVNGRAVTGLCWDHLRVYYGVEKHGNS